jgi:hypothetical protein
MNKPEVPPIVERIRLSHCNIPRRMRTSEISSFSKEVTKLL